MAHIEVDSFVTKFKNLWSAGFKATLTIEAVNGEASVHLMSSLGALQPLHHHGPRPRGPAYQRRQERRHQAARVVAAVGQPISPTEQVGETPEEGIAPAAEASAGPGKNEESVADKAKATDGKDVEKADKAEKTFPCALCDFTSNWQNGHRVHMTRKHSKIDQLDGHASEDNDEIDDDKEYTRTRHYWKAGWLGTVYQSFLDANHIIENSDLDEGSKVEEKQKLLEARKLAFGDNFRRVPPWT